MFTHLDEQKQPTMVDVSHKTETLRTATATCSVYLPPLVREKLVDGEIHSAKGPVFQTAVIAGTMGAKKTSELIPFCHPLAIESCKIQILAQENLERVRITCSVKIHHKTGVEMEALLGAQIAALTIYDMCKALSHEIRIEDLRLIEKHGGQRDYQA